MTFLTTVGEAGTDGVIIALTRFERFDSRNRHSRFGGSWFQVK